MPRRAVTLAAGLALLAGCGAGAPSTGSPVSASPAPSVSWVSQPTPSPLASSSVTWRLVVVGDSITTEGVPSKDSYGDLFAKLIEQRTGMPVDASVIEADTTDVVLRGLAGDGRLATAVSNADIVVLTVGANDADPFASHPAESCAVGTKPAACLAVVSPDLADRFEAILARLRVLTAGHPTAIRVTSPDYNPFIGWSGAPTPTSGLDYYRQVAEAYTDLVCRVAPEHEAKCADFLHAFNGTDGTADAKDLLGPDHLHPSLAGRQRIAEVLMNVGLDPLH